MRYRSMKAIHRCVYMKTNVVYIRNRYFYVLIWNIAGSSTRDRNFLCLSTRSAALHSWKDIKSLSLMEDPPVFHINAWKNLLIYNSNIHFHSSFTHTILQFCFSKILNCSQHFALNQKNKKTPDNDMWISSIYEQTNKKLC